MDWWSPVTARPAPTLPPDFFRTTTGWAGPVPMEEDTTITTIITTTTTTTTPFPWREAAAAVLDGVGEAVPEEGGVDVWVVGVASVAGTVVVGVLGAWIFRRVTGRNM